MPHQIDLHPNAQADLDSISRDDPVEFGRILSLLRELEVDRAFQQRMLDHGGIEKFGEARAEFKKWVGEHRKGNDLWRVKFLMLNRNIQLSPYRIIYAFHPWEQRDPNIYYVVLGVIHKDIFDYDDANNAVRARILKDYSEL